MSLWGAVVITSLITVIPWLGFDILHLVWGGMSIDNQTLNRLFSIHFVLPFILSALVLIHLISLHEVGSNNPIGISSASTRIPFHSYFTSKDLVGVFLAIFILGCLVFWNPYYLGHSDNNIPGNPLVTPLTIVPEWYFLPFYAILRAIPNKSLGVIFFAGALVILFFLPVFNTRSGNNLRVNRLSPIRNIAFWLFLFNFIFLMILGGKPVHEPYLTLSLFSTVIYFSYFIFLFVINTL